MRFLTAYSSTCYLFYSAVLYSFLMCQVCGLTLKYLCELNSIIFVMQEESYTSKASFWDQDAIPVFNCDDNEEYYFSGKRIHRRQYRETVDKF